VSDAWGTAVVVIYLLGVALSLVGSFMVLAVNGIPESPRQLARDVAKWAALTAVWPIVAARYVMAALREDEW
jgi:hypothetical protein